MAEHFDNAPGRLAATLRPLLSMEPSTPAAQGWSDVLGVAETEHLFARIGRLIALIDEAKKVINDVLDEGEHDFYLAPFGHIDHLPPRFLSHLGTGQLIHFRSLSRRMQLWA